MRFSAMRGMGVMAAAIRLAMTDAGVGDKQLSPQQLANILRRHKGPKGHAWDGRRRKLKRSCQNHQRNVSPSRRH